VDKTRNANVNAKVFCDLDGVLLPLVSIKGFSGIDSGFFAELAAGMRAGLGASTLADALAIFSIGVKAQQFGSKTAGALIREEVKVFAKYSAFLPPLEQMTPAQDYSAVFGLLNSIGKPATIELLQKIGAGYSLVGGAQEFLAQFSKRLFVVSCSPSRLVEALAKRCALPRSSVFATVLDEEQGRITGLTDASKVVRTQRKAEIVGRLATGGAAIAIGDSASDFEMLSLASANGLAIAFLPDEKLLQKVAGLENAVVVAKSDFELLARIVESGVNGVAPEIEGGVYRACECRGKMVEISSLVKVERAKQEKKYSGVAERLLEALVVGLV